MGQKSNPNSFLIYNRNYLNSSFNNSIEYSQTLYERMMIKNSLRAVFEKYNFLTNNIVIVNSNTEDKIYIYVSFLKLKLPAKKSKKFNRGKKKFRNLRNQRSSNNYNRFGKNNKNFQNMKFPPRGSFSNNKRFSYSNNVFKKPHFVIQDKSEQGNKSLRGNNRVFQNKVNQRNNKPFKNNNLVFYNKDNHSSKQNKTVSSNKSIAKERSFTKTNSTSFDKSNKKGSSFKPSSFASKNKLNRNDSISKKNTSKSLVNSDQKNNNKVYKTSKHSQKRRFSNNKKPLNNKKSEYNTLAQQTVYKNQIKFKVNKYYSKNKEFIKKLNRIKKNSIFEQKKSLDFYSCLRKCLIKYGFKSRVRLIIQNLAMVPISTRYSDKIEKLLVNFKTRPFYPFGLKLLFILDKLENPTILLSKFIKFFLIKNHRRPRDLGKFIGFLYTLVDHILPKTRLKGLKILIKGRFRKGKRSKTRNIKRGSMPLQTVKARINYSLEHTVTSYGVFGVKVWSYK